jgi:hypothetical protein
MSAYEQKQLNYQAGRDKYRIGITFEKFIQNQPFCEGKTPMLAGALKSYTDQSLGTAPTAIEAIP